MCVCSVIQLCPTLCDPMDYSPPGSFGHGIIQVRVLEWLPFPPPGDLPDPGIELIPRASPASARDSLPLCHLGSPWRGVWTFLQKLKIELPCDPSIPLLDIYLENITIIQKDACTPTFMK